LDAGSVTRTTARFTPDDNVQDATNYASCLDRKDDASVVRRNGTVGAYNSEYADVYQKKGPAAFLLSGILAFMQARSSVLRTSLFSPRYHNVNAAIVGLQVYRAIIILGQV